MKTSTLLSLLISAILTAAGCDSSTGPTVCGDPPIRSWIFEGPYRERSAHYATLEWVEFEKCEDVSIVEISCLYRSGAVFIPAYVRLRVGDSTVVFSQAADEWDGASATFDVSMYRNGKKVDASVSLKVAGGFAEVRDILIVVR